MAKRMTPEGYVLDAVLQYLAIKGVFAMRMNSGAIRLEAQNGRTRYFKGHEAGTADVLAFNRDGELFVPTWIECKAPNGKQSDLQRQFQEKVEAEGHVYVLAFGVDDVERVL
jgi:VRR-NUC domain